MIPIINGFYRYVNDYGDFDYARVVDACFTRNLLEKVTAEIVTDKKEFLEDSSNFKVRTHIFQHPYIPDEIVFAANNLNFDVYQHQCK